MLSSGMNTQSGNWQFDIGLPAKSSVSGVTIMVVPNTCGICVWSPKLNKDFNSNKGEIFLNRFVKEFEYNNLGYQTGTFELQKSLVQRNMLGKVEHIHLLYQAEKGDIKNIRRSIAIGRNVNFRDYDRRTALHLAASHGHIRVVKYLVRHDAVISVTDIFGNTPIDEARAKGHNDIVTFLEESI
jgi:glutaminase